jgi:hypothetical protein
MTKKHFIALAEEMIRLRGSINWYADTDSIDVQTVINRMADFCASQNPNFNRERWLGYIAGTNGKNGGKSL